MQIMVHNILSLFIYSIGEISRQKKLNYMTLYHSQDKKNEKCNVKMKYMYSLFGNSENRENNYLKIRDLLSIALFNILHTHYLIHI
jgi:hypothetical protein